MSEPTSNEATAGHPDPAGTSASPTALELLGPSAGGIRAHVAELTRRVTESGWHGVVAGPAGVMDGLSTGLDAVVEVPSSWSPRALRRARRQLRAALAERGVDVIHAHGLKAALVAEGLTARPPVVLTVHNLVAGTQDGWRARVLRPLEARILRRADHVVVISADGVERVRHLHPAERWSEVLPVTALRTPGRSRSQVRADLGVGGEDPLIVVVARLHPQKDLPTFIRAVDRLQRTRPAARAVIVGDGPDRDALCAEITRRDLGTRVVLAGHRPNPADEMAAADVVVLASRWEAGPLVAVECLALGRPFVTTAVGAITARLVDGRDARIVPIGDDQAMASAIDALLADPAAAERMGAAGRLAIEPLTSGDALVSPIVDVYTRLAGSRGH